MTALVISNHSFANTWASLVHDIMQNGRTQSTEYNELSKFRTAFIEYNRSAIEEMEHLELHPQFPTQKKHLLNYLFQFNENKGSKYKNFTYTYFLRLEKQLKKIADGGLKINSRRNIGITWQPEKDLGSNAPPCLIFFNLQRIDTITCFLHLHWRSRDIFNAYQSNLCALVYMINNSIVKKVNKNLKIYRIYEVIDNAHIYQSDWDRAQKIKAISENPQYYYR